MAASRRDVALIVGARPNFMKAAAVIRALKKRSDRFDVTLVHTGQHYDANMSDVFFRELQIPQPDVRLQVAGGNHVETIANVIRGTSDLFKSRPFDDVIVFGDVSSTVGAALAAIKNGQRIVHVEAGLRSFDRRMPEEINRVITDHVSDMLFASEPTAVENLKKEGIDPSRIFLVGNVMIDTLAYSLERIREERSAEKFGYLKGEYLVATIHRQENTDSPAELERIFRALSALAADRKVVAPLHPRTLKKIEEFGLAALLEGLHVIEPMGYFAFISLVMGAAAVVTDSGGIQEETSWLGVPCLTLRDSTERPLTVAMGTNRLITSRETDLATAIREALREPLHIGGSLPLWDGRAAERIADILERGMSVPEAREMSKYQAA